jgi:hypothetical protein
MYSHVEKERLNFICGSVRGIANRNDDISEDDDPDSENIDLPASFLGS